MLRVGDDLRSQAVVQSSGFERLHIVSVRCMLLLDAR